MLLQKGGDAFILCREFGIVEVHSAEQPRKHEPMMRLKMLVWLELL